MSILRLVAAVAMLALAACSSAPGAAPTPEVFGTAPTFRLTDQRGQAYGSDDLAGRVALVDFIYTHCTDACPILSATFARTQQRLAEQGLLGEKVLLVSISVDPLHDTPPVLAEYGQRYNADPTAWRFLTGDWDEVYGVIADFKVGARAPRPAPDSPPPGGTEITHSTRVVLLDRQGQVRGYLHGDEASADDLVAAVRPLL